MVEYKSADEVTIFMRRGDGELRKAMAHGFHSQESGKTIYFLNNIAVDTWEKQSRTREKS
ncbi:hypothetical protein ACLOJK_013206 [Asimina triloba]